MLMMVAPVETKKDPTKEGSVGGRDSNVDNLDDGISQSVWFPE